MRRGSPRRRDQRVDREIALARRRRPDRDGLIAAAHMRRPCIGLGIDRDRAHARGASRCGQCAPQSRRGWRSGPKKTWAHPMNCFDRSLLPPLAGDGKSWGHRCGAASARNPAADLGGGRADRRSKSLHYARAAAPQAGAAAPRHPPAGRREAGGSGARHRPWRRGAAAAAAAAAPASLPPAPHPAESDGRAGRRRFGRHDADRRNRLAKMGNHSAAKPAGAGRRGCRQRDRRRRADAPAHAARQDAAHVQLAVYLVT